ncbi:hypothetical protein [Borreliella bavariensis]|nr:hypothetical protein [Borreliella bavariensis]
MTKKVFAMLLLITIIRRMTIMSHIEKNQENIKNGVSNMIHTEQ